MGDADPNGDELTYLACGRSADVAMLPGVYKNQFCKLELAAQYALKHLMEIYADVGSENMPEFQFNNEGTYEHGGKKIALRAFKDGQERVYGARVLLGGRPTFICTATATKKRGKADPAKLKDAVKKLKPFVVSDVKQETAVGPGHEARGKEKRDGKASKGRKGGKGGREGRGA